MEQVEETIAEFSPNAHFEDTHPASPIRAKAIQVFSDSDLLKEYKSSGKITTDKKLNEKTSELTKLLEFHPDTKMDHFRSLMILYGGIFLSQIDGTIEASEKNKIIEKLSDFSVNPRRLYETITPMLKEPAKIEKIFHDAVRQIIQINPSERYEILNYFCNIAFKDRVLRDKEIDYLLKFSKKILGFEDVETAKLILHYLGESFHPRFS
jgi:uncharacterized membrane protein YebE (DUF533 family)